MRFPSPAEYQQRNRMGDCMGKMRMVGHEGNIVMSSNKKKKTFTAEIPRYNTLELFFNELGVGLTAQKHSQGMPREGVVILLPEKIKKIRVTVTVQAF